MDLNTQLTGLDQFLSTIYGSGTGLETLLGTLGFDAAQLNALRERHMPALAEGFIEVVRKRLTWEDKDLWFRLLARRFGLDGEPPARPRSRPPRPWTSMRRTPRTPRARRSRNAARRPPCRTSRRSCIAWRWLNFPGARRNPARSRLCRSSTA